MSDRNDIIERMPALVARGGTAEEYTEAHAEEFLELLQRRAEVVDAHQIDNVEGEELDRLGDLFGQLGARQGRGDSEYRSYIKSIIDSFNARGSLSGLRFAIAAAINTSEDNINIIEDFENLEYRIEIVDVDTEIITSAINDLAELADPSVVTLTEAVILEEPVKVKISTATTTVTDEADGLGSGEIGDNTLGT